MCLEPCPLNSWQNSTPFWPLTFPCSSSGSRVSNGHVSTREGHVSCVWDHVHWIPGKILPQFDPSRLSVAHWDTKLEIFINIEQVQDTCLHVKDTCHVSGTMSIKLLAKFYPIWPLTFVCSSSGSKVRIFYKYRTGTGYVSTCEGHVSRVWDHVHWIPGKILPNLTPHIPL